MMFLSVYLRGDFLWRKKDKLLTPIPKELKREKCELLCSGHIKTRYYYLCDISTWDISSCNVFKMLSDFH
jgi:hypothetical protein